MKISLLSLMVFLSTNLLFGQLKHEVKIEGFGAFINKNYIPSYELIIKKQIGIEVEMGFNLFDRSLPQSLSSPFDRIDFSQKRFNPAIGGKYYLLFNNYGNGVYIGPYFRMDFLLNLDKEFSTKWEELYNNTAPEWTEEGLRTIYYGLHGGFKWLIKSHFIIEPEFFGLIEKRTPEDRSSNNTYFLGEIYLRIGYRF